MGVHLLLVSFDPNHGGTRLAAAWRLSRGACILALLATLGACHERAVTVVRSPHPSRLETQAPARLGELTLTFVREVRRPTALGRFPDGGTPREMAAYFEVRQHAAGDSGRVVGRLPLERVDGRRYGDLLEAHWRWVSPSRFRWEVRHGFVPPLVRTDSGYFEVPPLGG